MKKTVQILLTVLCALVFSATADTLLASFDRGEGSTYKGFGPYTGASAQFTPVSDMMGSEGTTNGITLKTFDAGFWGGLIAPISTNPSALFGDYALQSDQGGRFSLTGLNTAQQYDIYVIAPNGSVGGDGGVFGGIYAVTNGTADITSVSATGGVAGPFTEWVAGRDFAVFSNAMSDETGEFSGTFTPIAGQTQTGLAGIQVVAVPEPATAGLFGLGALGAWIIRRNKKKATEEDA